MPLLLGVLIVAAVIALPLVVTLPSRQLVYASVACFAICAMSLSVITGWAGQLSLAQMTFAGFGALLSAAFVRGFELDVWVLDVQAPSLPFLVAIPLAAIVVSAMAVLIGLGALRVRGLQLAVTTFVFAVAAQQYIYRIPVFSDDNANSVSFRRGSLFGLSLDSYRTYYYVVRCRARPRVRRDEPSATQRHRSLDDRRSRQPRRGRGVHRFAGANQAHGLRHRRLRRGDRWRDARRPGPERALR